MTCALESNKIRPAADLPLQRMNHAIYLHIGGVSVCLVLVPGNTFINHRTSIRDHKRNLGEQPERLQQWHAFRTAY
eukprot:8037019-Pyramimonas_sp.AAC.1